MPIPTLLLALCLFPLSAQEKGKGVPPKAAAPRPVQWDGEWSLMDGASTDLGTAIPDHVKDLNFALKAFWKRKLEKGCPRETSFSLLAGDNLTLSSAKESPVVLQGDGSPTAWKRGDGESYQARMVREGAKLVLTFEGDGYTLRRVLVMDEAGTSFTLSTTYQNPKCPAGEFTYTLAYRRRS